MFYSSKRSSSKFFNEPLIVGGQKFASKVEFEMKMAISLLPAVKKIDLHKKFDLVVNGKKICAVMPDYTVHLKSGEILYADAKSDPTETAVSSIKFKLFEALYGSKIWILPREMGAFISLCENNMNHDLFLEVGGDDTNP